MTGPVHPPHLGRPPGEHTEHPPAQRIRHLLRLLLMVIAQNKRLRQQVRDLGGTPVEGLPADHPLMVAWAREHDELAAAALVRMESVAAGYEDRQ